MKQEEIFAEKVRALMTRQRARDLFDLHFLIKNKIYAEKYIIKKKMEYYNMDFDINKLIPRINELESQWEKELKGFVLNLPSFGIVRNHVARRIKELYL